MLMTPMTPNVIARPMRHQHEHRAEAQAEEQRLDARVEPRARDRCGSTASAAARRTLRVALERRCRRRTARAARPAGCALRAAAGATASRSPRAAASDSLPSSAASARPVSISALTPGVGLDPVRWRSSSMVASSSDAQHLPDGVEPHRRVGTRQREAREAVLSTRRSRLLVPILVSSSRAAGAGVARATAGRPARSDAEHRRRPIWR